MNATDIVPILPSANLSMGLLTLSCAHVTDAWSWGNNSGDSLVGNVVSFCIQSGDIGGNHSCLNVYLPYLAALAGGFSTAIAAAA